MCKEALVVRRDSTAWAWCHRETVPAKDISKVPLAVHDALDSQPNFPTVSKLHDIYVETGSRAVAAVTITMWPVACSWRPTPSITPMMPTVESCFGPDLPVPGISYGAAMMLDFKHRFREYGVLLVIENRDPGVP
jgi:hypothetical protein